MKDILKFLKQILREVKTIRRLLENDVYEISNEKDIKAMVGKIEISD